MKTNISIELTDKQRSQVATVFDGRPTKRMASRAELVEFCQGCVSALLPVATAKAVKVSTQIAPEDSKALLGKSQSYIRGYNQVKHRNR
jgi:hypothetical protein